MNTPVANAGSACTMSRIPKRIIQTSRNSMLEPLAEAASVNVKLLHPDWEYLFFDDTQILKFVSSEFPEYVGLFQSYSRPIQRVDLFRYLAVYRLGGFYLDLDVFLTKSLEPLTTNSAVFPFEGLTMNEYFRNTLGIDWEVGNYAFGAEAGNEFLGQVIKNCARAKSDPKWIKPVISSYPRYFAAEFEVLATTGPGLLTRTLADPEPGIAKPYILFPQDVCDLGERNRFGKFGIHAMAGSWRGRGGIGRRLGWWLLSKKEQNLLKLSRIKGPTRSM